MSSIKYDRQKYVDALYTDQIIPEFVGNPTIEALPDPIESRQILKKVRYVPIFTEPEKNASINQKLIAIDKIKSFRYPLEMYPTIQYNFDSLNQLK